MAASRYALGSIRRITRAVSLIISLFLIAGAATAASHAQTAAKKDDGFQTSATSAILIDAEGDSVLFEKNADELVAPASLAKLMTTEVVFNEIKEGRLKLDQEFVISEYAWRHGGAPSRTSSMFAPIKSRVRVQDLLYSVIVQSGNDACIALAEGISGNERAFADKMTQRARALGLSKSVFTNSTGLPDPELKVTVRELADLARYIIVTYPDFYKIYNEREFTWNKIRQTNRNPLLAMSLGADGLKTGYTEDAGYGIAGSAVQSGFRQIMVAVGFKHDKERADESRRMLEWGFNNFESRTLFNAGQTVAEAKVYGGDKGYVSLVTQKPIRIMVQKNGSEKITGRVSYQGPVAVPVTQGQEIGTLRISRNDTVALEVPLHAGENAIQGSLGNRTWDAASEVVINLVRAGLKKL